MVKFSELIQSHKVLPEPYKSKVSGLIRYMATNRYCCVDTSIVFTHSEQVLRENFPVGDIRHRDIDHFSTRNGSVNNRIDPWPSNEVLLEILVNRNANRGWISFYTSNDEWEYMGHMIGLIRQNKKWLIWDTADYVRKQLCPIEPECIVEDVRKVAVGGRINFYLFD